MKNRIVYLSSEWLLFVGIGLLIAAFCLPAKAQDTFADFMREEVKTCKQNILDAEIRMNNLEILIKAYPPSAANNFDADDRWSNWVKELSDYKQWKYRLLCHSLEMSELTLSRVATPTPTPSPTPNPVPTPASTPKVSTDKKLIPEEEEAIERWKKLHERLPLLSAEINDWVKEKKKQSPPKPPDDVKWQNKGDSFFDIFIEFDIGNIRLKLPKDIRPGDIITGSLTAEPKGKTEAERKKNEAELKNYGIEIVLPPLTPVSPTAKISFASIWRVPSINSTFKFYLERPLEPLPAGYQTPINVAVTKNDSQTGIPIELVQLSLVSIVPIKASSPNNWQMPQLIQIGNPVEILGKFDGIADSTILQINGKSLEIIAESPRSCIFNTKPSEVGSLAYAQGNDVHFAPGQSEIIVKEGDNQQKLPFRAVGVGLSAPKLNLLRGEKTTVTVQVSGLKDLLETEIIPLQLVSSGVINMEGGDSQSLQIRKKDVDKDGIYRTTREVIGHSNGGWGVTATVIDPRRRPIIIPLSPNSKGNGYRSETRKGENYFTVFEVRHPLTGKPLEGEHKVEFGCEGNLSKIPYISRLFMNNGKSSVKTECLIIITPRIIIDNES